ncbi:MAG TPA: sulfatase-like hydrolase/transferase [Gammaproteobacteria bacterium]
MSGATLVAVLYGYMSFMEGLGGFSTGHVHTQFIELGLVLYCYALCYIALQPGRWRSALAALPVVLVYLVHDVFYLAFGKVFRLINIFELSELVQILPWRYAALLLVILFLPLGLFLLRVDYRRLGRLLLWSLPLLLLATAIKGAPGAYTHSFEQLSTGIVNYSDGKSVERNGRLAMLTYREAQRSAALAQLEPYHDRARYDQEAAALATALHPHTGQRDIHLIVLESFLDPRLFRDLRFSSSPVHPSFDQLFGDKLGLSVGPVFGGATAQAEFEVLCGVPAFERLSSIEFNIFTGTAAHCLPGTLADLGYRSVASNAYKPNFFNALPAYQGIGFTESHFPAEFTGARTSYLRLGDVGVEEYLFDAPLFEQNLNFVREHKARHPEQPLFNYLLTIYGHTPHLLDPVRRPQRIVLDSSYPDEQLDRAVNQFYYRSEAVAAYVNQLLAIDSNSLIILIADHVPPLDNGPNTYEALRYLDNRDNSYYYNRIAILENGTATVYPELHHFELPALILNYASKGAYCRQQACSFTAPDQSLAREAYMERYLQLMAHAAE